MQRFQLNYKDDRLLITHSLHPECVIEVINLADQSFWGDAATMGDVFDFFIFHKKDGNVLLMLLVVDYNDVGVYGPDAVDDAEVPAYRQMLRKAWKWLLHRYLLVEGLPGEPRSFGFDDEPEDEREFSLQNDDGVMYVYHRTWPIFKAKLKPYQDELGLLKSVEWLEQPDVEDVPRLLSKMGDWISKYSKL